MGAETGRVGALRAAADAVRVQRVPVRVEPLHALGLVLPLAVEETLDLRHPVVLAGLHLGATSRSGRSRAWSRHCRKSRRWCRGSSRRTCSFDVADDVAIPAQGLFPVEVPAHDETATPAQQRQRLRGYRAGFDVGVVDDGPDRLAAFPCGGDVVDLGLDLLLDDGEDLFDRAA